MFGLLEHRYWLVYAAAIAINVLFISIMFFLLVVKGEKTSKAGRTAFGVIACIAVGCANIGYILFSVSKLGRI
jgi:hypothetical protein